MSSSPSPKKSTTGIKIVIALVVVISLLIFGVIFYQNRQRDQAAEDFRVLVSDTCRDVEQLTDKQSVDSLFDQYREGYDKIFLKYDDLDDLVSRLNDSAYKCLNDAQNKFAPVTVPEPVKKSDAELAAEGRSCSQQWKRANTETLSGSSNDVQLRATVYACDTWDDWFLEAFELGEYSDSLLSTICYVEENAPDALCN